MSADRGYWAEVGETSSVLRPMNTQALVRSAEEQGVSTYLHPILSYPFNPVVLVEGNNDEVVLNHVANVVGRSLLKFVTLRSEEHTSELQSLMRNSYAGVCLKKKQ